LLAEANLLSAIHIADNDGVTFETCTAEVFRPVPTHCKTEVLPCAETRKDSAVHVSLSSSLLVKQPGSRELPIFEVFIRRQITTDNYRLLIHSS